MHVRQDTPQSQCGYLEYVDVRPSVGRMHEVWRSAYLTQLLGNLLEYRGNG